MSSPAPRVLAIACGNTLRRDDGVAHYLLELLDGVEKRASLQLSPEIAQEIAGFEIVFFLDADAEASRPAVTPVDGEFARQPFTHHARAAEIVHLAASLYGFIGEAFLCRIPVTDLDYGEGLTADARGFAKQAAALIEAQIKKRTTVANGSPRGGKLSRKI